MKSKVQGGAYHISGIRSKLLLSCQFYTWKIKQHPSLCADSTHSYCDAWLKSNSKHNSQPRVEFLVKCKWPCQWLTNTFYKSEWGDLKLIEIEIIKIQFRIDIELKSGTNMDHRWAHERMRVGFVGEVLHTREQAHCLETPEEKILLISYPILYTAEMAQPTRLVSTRWPSCSSVNPSLSTERWDKAVCIRKFY